MMPNQDHWVRETKYDRMMPWVMNLAVLAAIVLGVMLYASHQIKAEDKAEFIEISKEWEKDYWVLKRVHSGLEPPYWWSAYVTPTRYMSDAELERLAECGYNQPDPECPLHLHVTYPKYDR
jgi:hypothetical protein